MKKLILICIIILIPLCVFSQELGMKYSFNKFKDFSEDKLDNRLFWNNTATVGSVLLSIGGVTAIGIGSYYGIYFGFYALASIFSDSLMEPLSVLFAYFSATTSVAGFGLAVLGYGALKMSINAIGQLNNNRQLIKLELTRFQPSSYMDSPGIGIGVSLSLN